MELCDGGRPRCGCPICGGAPRGPTAGRAWPDRGGYLGQVADNNSSDQHDHDNGTGSWADHDEFDDRLSWEVAHSCGAVKGQVVENLDTARLRPLPYADHDPNDPFAGSDDDAAHGDDDNGTDQSTDDNNDGAAADDDSTTNDRAINHNHDGAAWVVIHGGWESPMAFSDSRTVARPTGGPKPSSTAGSVRPDAATSEFRDDRPESIAQHEKPVRGRRVHRRSSLRSACGQ
jgi:hypothetical protein